MQVHAANTLHPQFGTGTLMCCEYGTDSLLLMLASSDDGKRTVG